jgi:hypothetical protein
MNQNESPESKDSQHLPYAESALGPNTVTVIDDGPGDTTVRPIPDSLRPYLNWHPRPEKRPPADG